MNLVWYELAFPAGSEPDRAIGWARSLTARGRAGWLTSTKPLAFELRADRRGVHWFLGAPAGEGPALRRSLESWLPGISALPVVALRPDSPSLAVDLRLRSKRRELRADLQPDISRGVLQVLGHLHGEERVVLQWVVGGWMPRRPVPPKTEQDIPRTLRHVGEWGRPHLGSEEISEARRKASDQLFACAGRIAVDAATLGRARKLVSRVLGVYQVARTPGAGLSRRSLPSSVVRSRLHRTAVNQLDPTCPLRADELVALLAWPIGHDRHEDLPGIDLGRSRLLKPDRRVLRAQGLRDQRVVAESGYPSSPGNLVLTPKDALRHQHILGPTGVGKSTLLARLILQDVEAGRGVVVVDPKGDLVDDVLARISPEAVRSDRVAVLDPSDAAPLGLNPLTGGSSSVAVDGLLGVLHSLWSSSWGPRLNDVLHAGLLTLAADGQNGHSLVELSLLLTNRRFRRPLAARAGEADPLGLGAFWGWFDSLSDEQSAQVLGPVMNKLRAFILRPDLRAVLGQNQPRFDLSSVFTDQRALLVRLPKGQVGGDAAALVGSLVVQQVWQATLARTRIPARARRPVFVYLDEFQEFVRLPLDLGDALAQARGLGVGLVLAHQHLGQLGTELRSAVLANAGSRVVFRLDHDDASVIAKRTSKRLTPEDFSSLPPFHAYADLVAEDAPRGFASARTLPLPPSRQNAIELRAANQRRWGVPRVDTEAHLRSLLDAPAPAPGSELFGVIPPSGGNA